MVPKEEGHDADISSDRNGAKAGEVKLDEI